MSFQSFKNTLQTPSFSTHLPITNNAFVGSVTKPELPTILTGPPAHGLAAVTLVLNLVMLGVLPKSILPSETMVVTTGKSHSNVFIPRYLP